MRVNGQLVSRRFPQDTTLTMLKAWREQARTRAKFGARYPEDDWQEPTFRDDVDRYPATVTTMPTYEERRRHLLMWAEVFGNRPRMAITPVAIATQLDRWLGEGLAAGTVNRRRTVLMALWTRMDGRGAANPVKQTPRFREPDPEPRELSYQTVRRILAAMPASKTRARLSVIAWTGLPHHTLMQLRPEHPDRRRRTLWVPGRRKGAGTLGRRIPLSREALAAFAELARYDAWGDFSSSAMYKSFQLACRHLGLTGLRPYDFRHSFGTMVDESSSDIRATQALMGHASSRLTERYTLAAVAPQMAKALARFDAVTKEAKVGPRGAKKVARKVATRGRT